MSDIFSIRLMNEISPVVSAILSDGYDISRNADAPDAIVVRSADLHNYARGKKLLAIARAGAGYNNIPVDDCSADGVVVFNTPGANANAVSELVLAAMLMTGRDIIGAANWVLTLKGQNNDDITKEVEKEKARFGGPELRGKTLGVVGLGAIGALVANAAVGLGMEVYGHDPFISVEHAWALSRSIRRVTDRDELIMKSDFISVHVPLIPQTRGMFNADMLRKMKPGATLLNFSRGELADCAAVVEAVKSGKLRAYATDFPCEAMLGVPGILSIPHLGASTPESEENCARMAAEQIRDFLEHGAVRNSVNLPDVDLPRSEANRVTIIHKNIPNTLGAITAVLGGDNINIANLVNKSKGAVAYTVLDIDGDFTDAQLAKLSAVDGVLKVRTV